MAFISTITRQYRLPFFIMWVVLLTFLFSILFIIRSAGIQNFVQATANLKYLADPEFCIFESDCTLSANSCEVVNVYYKDAPYIGDKFSDIANSESCKTTNAVASCVKNKCQVIEL